MVFEDMQWADAALLDFVEHLLEWSRNHPLFVLTLARPELTERRLHADGEASLRRERASRLPAALERAGVDRGNRKRSEPLGERFGLLLPPDGEMDAGLPAGEPLAGRVRQRVTDEQEDAHDARA